MMIELPSLKNTELNVWEKNISLRKSEVSVKEFQFVMSLKFFAKHGIYCLPCSYINDAIDVSVATMMPY